MPQVWYHYKCFWKLFNLRYFDSSFIRWDRNYKNPGIQPNYYLYGPWSRDRNPRTTLENLLWSLFLCSEIDLCNSFTNDSQQRRIRKFVKNGWTLQSLFVNNITYWEFVLLIWNKRYKKIKGICVKMREQEIISSKYDCTSPIVGFGFPILNW